MKIPALMVSWSHLIVFTAALVFYLLQARWAWLRGDLLVCAFCLWLAWIAVLAICLVVRLRPDRQRDSEKQKVLPR